MLFKLSYLLRDISDYLLKGLALAMPLFFLPFDFLAGEFAAQFFLWLIAPLGLFALLFGMIAGGKIEYRRTPLFLPAAVFLGAVFISSLLGASIFTSFFGAYGDFKNSFLGILSLVLLCAAAGYFKKEDAAAFFRLSLVSYSAVLFYFLGRIFGLLGSSVFYDFTPFMVLAAAMSVLILALAAAGSLAGASKRGKAALGGVMFFSLLFLLFTAIGAVWLVMAAGALFIFFLNRGRGQDRPDKKISRFAFVAAVFFVFALLNLNLYHIFFGRPLERMPELAWKHSGLIIWESVKENIFFGSGSGSFGYAFSRFRPEEFNNLSFWNIRFSESGSHIGDILNDFGFVGLLSYLLLIAVFVYLSFALIKRSSGREENAVARGFLRGILPAVFALLLFQFFYSLSTAVVFVFWLLLALAAALWPDLAAGLGERADKLFPRLEIFYEKDRRRFHFVFLTAVLFFLGWVILAGFETKFFVADFFYRRGGEAGLSAAVRLNGRRAEYKIALSKYFLKKALAAEAGDEIKADMEKAIFYAKDGVKTDTKSVAAAEILAAVYRDIGGLAEGGEVYAADNFKRASALEPTNPVLLSELGKAYLAAGELDKAEEILSAAAQQKRDYFDARFNLAKVYSERKNYREAAETLENLAAEYDSADVYYELGRAYFNQGQIAKAIADFNITVGKTPNHSNALYSLGLSYEALGEKDKTLEYFKKVLELNPGNEEVMGKIGELGEKYE